MAYKTNILDDILTLDIYITRRLRGESDEKITKSYYVSIRTLKRWKAKMGVGTSYINQQRSTVIQELYNKGKTWDEIGKVLNLTVVTCRNIHKQFLQCG